MTLDRIRFVVLAALAFSACKNEAGLDEGTLDAPSERDASAPAAATDASASSPPFDWTSLFPTRDAGRPQAADAGRDAGSSLATFSATLALAGGTIQWPDGGIALVAPRGAVSRNVQLTFSELPSPPPGFAGRAFLISPPSTLFAKPVEVAIQLSPALLEIAPANAWAVATLANGTWTALPGQTTGAGGVFVQGTSQQLGAFALIQVDPRPLTEPDAGAPLDASIADAGHDAAAPQVDAALSDASVTDAAAADAAQKFCQAGACANGTCVEGYTDYGCACNTGFTLGPDLHSCVAAP